MKLLAQLQGCAGVAIDAITSERVEPAACCSLLFPAAVPYHHSLHDPGWEGAIPVLSRGTRKINDQQASNLLRPAARPQTFETLETVCQIRCGPS